MTVDTSIMITVVIIILLPMNIILQILIIILYHVRLGAWPAHACNH